MWPYIIAAGALGAGYEYLIKPWLAKSPAHVNPITGASTPVHPVTGQPVPPGTPPFAQTVTQSGAAVSSAKTLHDYLKKTGTADGLDATAKAMVLAFQKAANTDKLAVAIHGPLPVTGSYDTRTSAALTLYTKDPIPAEPTAPKPVATPAQLVDLSIPGDAAMSNFNLATYLKQNGNDGSDALVKLVRQFQTDVNTDPKFPGPVSEFGVKIITAPLAVTGKYDVATWTALKVGTPDAPSP